MTQTLEAPAKSPYRHLWGGGSKEAWIDARPAPSAELEQHVQIPLIDEATDLELSLHVAAQSVLPEQPESDEFGPLYYNVSGHTCNVWSAAVARVISL